MTSQDPITPRARALFDRASDGLDHGIAFRLRRSRLEAQQAGGRPRSRSLLMPAGALAATVLALGLAVWQPATSPASGADLAGNAELDALVIDEDPELYAWLAEAPVATRTGPRL